MTTSIVARRSLLELAILRGLLDGSIDPGDLGVEGKTDGGNRREAAIRLVDRLARMHATVLESAALSEGIAFDAAGGRELLEGQGAQHQEPEPEPFGFARHRSDVRNAA